MLHYCYLQTYHQLFENNTIMYSAIIDSAIIRSSIVYTVTVVGSANIPCIKHKLCLYLYTIYNRL